MTDLEKAASDYRDAMDLKKKLVSDIQRTEERLADMRVELEDMEQHIADCRGCLMDAARSR